MATGRQFEPKLFTMFREGYSRKQFASDAISGVVVGIVAFPLAIAFAIASGVKPEQGLYTAIVAGLAVSVLGGSRVQIAGPTGAFTVIIYSIVQQYGFDGMIVATLIAGVILLIMGFARLGTLLRFVPHPLTVGFTSGIAVIIFSSQLKDFLGMSIKNLPAGFLEKWAVYGRAFQTIDPPTIGIALLSLLIIVFWPRVTHKIPGSLVAIVVATALVHILDIHVATIGSRFGVAPNHLPMPKIPNVSWTMITQLFSPGLTIALLAAIESLLSAVVADGMLGTRHRSNMELIAQGTANILSPIFGGIPATGAIARTATNIKTGGRTPVAGIIHALTLVGIMILFGKWTNLIPMATLAAILVVVAYNMSEWHSFVRIFRSPPGDIAVMVTTFLLTVLIDLTVAIEIGVMTSALLFMKRMADVSQTSVITKELSSETEEDEFNEVPKRTIPDGVEVFEVFGSLFFAAVDQFRETIRQIEKKPTVLIIETKQLLAIDASGLHLLDEIVTQSKKEGTTILLSGIHKQPLFAASKSGLLDRIGEDNVIGDLDEALKRASEILKQTPA